MIIIKKKRAWKPLKFFLRLLRTLSLEAFPLYLQELSPRMAII